MRRRVRGPIRLVTWLASRHSAAFQNATAAASSGRSDSIGGRIVSTFHHFDRPVIVAVIAVGMMEPAVHEVIGVVSVRDGFMAAAGAVDMRGVVRAGRRLATIRIGGVHGQRVLVVMPFMRVMQMTVVQIVDVSVVLDGGVAAAGAVLMMVILVGVMMLGHDFSFWLTVQLMGGDQRSD